MCAIFINNDKEIFLLKASSGYRPANLTQLRLNFWGKDFHVAFGGQR